MLKSDILNEDLEILQLQEDIKLLENHCIKIKRI